MSKNRFEESIQLDKQVLKKHIKDILLDVLTGEEEIEKLKKENLELKNKLKNSEEIAVQYANNIIALKKEKIEISNKLLNAYIKEENLLKSYSKLLEKKEELSKKYKALNNSKLGKVTLWYWKKRKEITR
ncbi:hypothetical protein BH721_07640 [Clostridium baratii]|uniref:hypothetical protein n=1 Tax=Clostridium baratii TaxID=1561 RepID=UPI0006C21D99|nr:hypothetical protein [Clostridium baratii]OPF50657.1 hypothetical protein A1M12_07420 [Clostridium baratii]OPF54099.1 hypothetical protein BH721_07640 [Clostridium baratii]OPF58663.1 hypothetical protein BH724_00545 [Clostridium baratii]OPF58965.1 hypothetical protein BH725_10095 [Clostridium baratii]CUP47881.1 Uncharacterised protein [Clostridium baratii]